MAKLIMWTDFKQPLLDDLEKCSDTSAIKSALSKALPTDAPDASDQQRTDIVLDMLAHTYQKACAMQCSPLQASTLMSIMWRTHQAAVRDRLTIERSFQMFRDTLMNHSLHRPPFSAGVFTLQQMTALVAWALHSYFRHYKLYQYAFTARVTLAMATHEPGADVEVPGGLPSLHEALGPEEYQALLEEQQQQMEEQRRQEEEAAAALAAAEAQAAALREEDAQQQKVAAEYEVAVPEEVAGHVGQVLEKEMAWLRRSMAQQFEEQQAALLAKVAALETKLAAANAAVAGSK